LRYSGAEWWLRNMPRLLIADPCGRPEGLTGAEGAGGSECCGRAKRWTRRGLAGPSARGDGWRQPAGAAQGDHAGPPAPPARRHRRPRSISSGGGSRPSHAAFCMAKAAAAGVASPPAQKHRAPNYKPGAQCLLLMRAPSTTRPSLRLAEGAGFEPASSLELPARNNGTPHLDLSQTAGRSGCRDERGRYARTICGRAGRLTRRGLADPFACGHGGSGPPAPRERITRARLRRVLGVAVACTEMLTCNSSAGPKSSYVSP
jgi:hypothetical protein